MFIILTFLKNLDTLEMIQEGKNGSRDKKEATTILFLNCRL